MAISPEEIERRTQAMLQKHRQNREKPQGATPTPDQVPTVGRSVLSASIPELREGEFLIEVDLPGGDGALFCVRELTWTEAMDIESGAFRENEQGKVWFAGEQDRRETLKKAIVWVMDKATGQVVRNDVFGALLNQLGQSIVESLWPRYQMLVSLNADEAQALYSSAQKYFKGEAQTGYPVKPIVVEVDYMLKGIISLSRDEFRKLTMSDLERIQLVLSARADVLGLASPRQEGVAQGVENKSNFNNDLLRTLPPHVRSRLPI